MNVFLHTLAMREPSRRWTSDLPTFQISIHYNRILGLKGILSLFNAIICPYMTKRQQSIEGITLHIFKSRLYHFLAGTLGWSPDPSMQGMLGRFAGPW
jgi:hypothetical protein